jgi:hypothetical protein
MTASGLNVVLPSATTMSNIGEAFVITITPSSYICWLKNNSGTIIYGPMYPGRVYTIALEDNSTAAGQWRIQAPVTAVMTRGGIIPTFSVSTIGMNPGGFNGLVALSSTSAVQFYNDGANVKAVVLSVSGATVTYGTPVTIYSAGVNPVQEITVAPVSSSSCVAAVTGQDGRVFVYALSISGTTITSGGVTLYSTIGSYDTTARIYYSASSSAGVITWANSAGNITVYVTPFTVSGTTITLGSSVGLTGLNWPDHRAAAAFTGTNQLLLAHSAANTGQVSFRACTISANVITVGTALSVYPNGGSLPLVYGGTFSPAANVASFNGTSGRSWLVTQSGTTVSSAVEQYGGANQFPPYNTVSGNNFIFDNGLNVTYFNSGGFQSNVGPVDGYPGVINTCMLDASTALCTGTIGGSSNYFMQAFTLKVA